MWLLTTRDGVLVRIWVSRCQGVEMNDTQGVRLWRIGPKLGLVLLDESASISLHSSADRFGG